MVVKNVICGRCGKDMHPVDLTSKKGGEKRTLFACVNIDCDNHMIVTVIEQEEEVKI